MANYIVDTSIWIDFLRGKLTSHLADLLRRDISRGRVAITDIIRHEILVGSRNRTDYENLQRLLSPLECFRIAEEELAQFDQFAWNLHRRGLKNSYTDLAIAFICHHQPIPLLAKDSYFNHLGRIGLIKTHQLESSLKD